MNDSTHLKYTGVSNTLILQNLMTLANAGKQVAIRIPLISGITDTDENITSMIDFLAPFENIRRISLLPYNRLADDKCRRFDLVNRLEDVESQTPEELNQVKARFESHGYTVSIGG